MQTKLDEISEAIGSLRAEIRNLGSKIDRADTVAVEGVKRADEHRAAMHRRVDDMVGEISDIKNDMVTVKRDLTDVKSDVADAKQVTDEVRKWRLMGMGALSVTGIAAAAISSAVTYYWADLLRWFRGM